LDIKKVLIFTADDQKSRTEWFKAFQIVIESLNEKQVLKEGDEEEVLIKTDFEEICK
jgi:hypothetical protein